MKTGVAIVTYNRLELLKECIACVVNQTIPFSKIVIVDNCSTDGTSEYLHQFDGDEKFHIIYEDENLGGSGGFYEAIKAIQTYDLDWDLIIDDDAMISPDYMEQLIRFSMKYSDVNALSGTVYTEGKIVPMHRRKVANELLFLETNVALDKYKKKAFRYDLGTFCGLVIRHSVLKEIGLPKREYFIWYDDTEYCLRLKPYGGIVNVNAARLNHKTGLPMEEKNIFLKTNWKSYYGYRNRYDAVKTHYGPWTQFIVWAQFFAFQAISLLMLFGENSEKASFNLKMFGEARRDGDKGCLGKNPNYMP